MNDVKEFFNWLISIPFQSLHESNIDYWNMVLNGNEFAEEMRLFYCIGILCIAVICIIPYAIILAKSPFEGIYEVLDRWHKQN